MEIVEALRGFTIRTTRGSFFCILYEWHACSDVMLLIAGLCNCEEDQYAASWLRVSRLTKQGSRDANESNIVSIACWWASSLPPLFQLYTWKYLNFIQSQSFTQLCVFNYLVLRCTFSLQQKSIFYSIQYYWVVGGY